MKFVHYTTQRTYRVLFMDAINTATNKKEVVYQDVETEQVYTRSFEEFTARVQRYGETVKRFTQID